MGLFDKLKQGLDKTKRLLKTDVRDLFRAGEIIDEPKLQKFHQRLIATDMRSIASRFTYICSGLGERSGNSHVGPTWS